MFLIAKRAEKDDFSQKSDEDGLIVVAVAYCLNQGFKLYFKPVYADLPMA